jgi:hypothetical protein
MFWTVLGLVYLADRSAPTVATNRPRYHIRPDLGQISAHRGG